MGDRSAAGFRLLHAELGAELARVDRVVDEIGEARSVLAAGPSRLDVYGGAALLETFYTGLEKALTRAVRPFEGAPGGSAWHRALLEAVIVDVPELRPAILSPGAAEAVERFLSFRHRFRNLYLFDLEAAPVSELLASVPEAWRVARRDLEGFRAWLLLAAKALEP